MKRTRGGDRKGKGMEGWEYEETEWLSGRKDRVQDQWKTYLDTQSHYGFREKSGAGEIPRYPQGWPQLRLLAKVERVLELTLSCNQTGEYPNYHHQVFTQELMEPDTEIDNQGPGWALEIQSRSGKRETTMNVCLSLKAETEEHREESGKVPTV